MLPMSELPTLTIDGRTVVLVDSGCDLSPRLHLVWLRETECEPAIFGAVLGDNEDAAHEYLADAVQGKFLSAAHVNQLAKEALAEGLSPEDAWAQATDELLPLNGGAEYIDAGDWGWWSAALAGEKLIRAHLELMRREGWNRTPPGPRDHLDLSTIAKEG